MDDGAVTNPNAEASLDLLREHRDEMAVWLALEVLQMDQVALDDPELLIRLAACQERLEQRLRERTARVNAARTASP